jgi:hypothetical protein
MKNEGGREAGKCSKMAPDGGDRCLFTCLSSVVISDVISMTDNAYLA